MDKDITAARKRNGGSTSGNDGRSNRSRGATAHRNPSNHRAIKGENPKTRPSRRECARKPVNHQHGAGPLRHHSNHDHRHCEHVRGSNPSNRIVRFRLRHDVQRLIVRMRSNRHRLEQAKRKRESNPKRTDPPDGCCHRNSAGDNSRRRTVWATCDRGRHRRRIMYHLATGTGTNQTDQESTSTKHARATTVTVRLETANQAEPTYGGES